MKAFKVLLATLTVLLTVSCLGGIADVTEVPTNDNAVFYGSEWSVDKQNEGLKFYSDNTVLYFSASAGNKTGSFTYNKSSAYISFDGLTIIQSPSAEITGASVISDNSIKVYWHKLGQSENYYMMMYKRR